MSSRVEHPFDQLDGLSADQLSALESRRLGQLLQRARRASFFRERLSGRLEELPFLTRQDLVEHGPPRSRVLLTGPLERAVVFQSGGTTGKPKYSLYSHADYRRLSRSTGRTLWAPGLRPQDRCANMFAVGELYASFLTIHRGLEEVGATSFPFTFHAPREQVLACLEPFSINVLMGLATQMVALGEALMATGRARVNKLFYAAEHLYPEDRRKLVDGLGLEVVATAGYGAVDVGMIGYQCPCCQGGVHHALGGVVIVELVDEEDRPIREPGVTGHLVVTNLERLLMPVIRYRVGDLGRWVAGDCPCGRASRRFELLGRGDDVLRIGYENVTWEDVRAALGGLASFTMIKRRPEGRDLLLIQVEQPVNVEQVVALLLQRKPNLAEHVRQGYTHPVRVERVERLERRAHSGKLRRVRDESL